MKSPFLGIEKSLVGNFQRRPPRGGAPVNSRLGGHKLAALAQVFTRTEKKRWNHPCIIIDVRNATLTHITPNTSPTCFDPVETICDVKALSPHDSSGYFSIADTDPIKPIDKRARKVHSEYTKAPTRNTIRKPQQVPMG